MRILGIYRAERFSPNSVENDRKIMRLTLENLRSQGHDVSEITEEEIIANHSSLTFHPFSFIFIMARSEEALKLMNGQKCINTPEGIRICSNRSRLDKMIRENDIPCPPLDGPDGIWLKRGDESAQVPEDTVFCQNKEEERIAMEQFENRGITNIVRQAHIPGDLVKFYSVAGTDFFYYFYPTDSGRSKFGSEKHNGEAHHYPFSSSELKASLDRLASIVGVSVYGGDVIVRQDGSFAIIDFNDWPTFSPCREIAARAIATLVHS